MTTPPSTEDLAEDLNQRVREAMRSETAVRIQAIDREHAEERLRSVIKLNAMKEKYGEAFLQIARAQLLSVGFLTLLAGLRLEGIHPVRILSYSENELPIIIGGTLAEVFGIVYVITSSLYAGGNASENGDADRSQMQLEKVIKFVKAFDKT